MVVLVVVVVVRGGKIALEHTPSAPTTPNTKGKLSQKQPASTRGSKLLG